MTIPAALEPKRTGVASDRGGVAALWPSLRAFCMAICKERASVLPFSSICR